MKPSESLAGSDGPSPKVQAPLALLAMSFVLVMIDGYDMFIVSFVAPLIAAELHLTAVSIGTIFAAGLAGSMVGGLVLGPVADRLGRRPVLLVSLVAAGVATLLCSQAQSLQAFAALRFLAGFALGGFLAAVVPLVAEYFPAERRSGAVTLMFIGYPLGAVVGGAITSQLLGHGWRSLFVGTGVLTLLVLPIGFLMRETLQRPQASPRDVLAGKRGISIVELFTNGRLSSTLIASLGIFSLLLVTYLMNSWTPLIAAKAGFKPATAALCGVFLNLGGVVGALLSIVLARRYGVFRVAALMIACGSLAVASIGHLYGSVAALFSGLFVSGVLVIGGQQNCPAMSVELYPQRMRAAGAGWQFAAGRFGSILGPIVGGHLLASGMALETLFLLVAAPALLSGAAYAIVELIRPKSHADPAAPPQAAHY